MPDTNPSAAFKSWIGNTCREVSRSAHDWLFQFENGTLVVSCPWRIIADGGIAHADEDDGQKFGLPKPVDGAERTMRLLAGRKIASAEVSAISGDLKVHFEDDRCLEIFNNSSGYEGWQATIKNGRETVGVVAQGGGQISMWTQ